MGRPVQAYNAQGGKVWEAGYDIYGGLRNIEGGKGFIPFRQAGQYEDVEIGLYYNRFRYYNPQTGAYLSKDPVGLEGNNPGLYGYVHDSNTEVDVFGLNEGSYKIYQIHSPGTKDVMDKGLHFYGKNNIEISIIPTKDGIDFKPTFSTKNMKAKELAKVEASLKDARKKLSVDSAWRDSIVSNAAEAKKAAVTTFKDVRNSQSKSAEFHFVEKNAQKIKYN